MSEKIYALLENLNADIKNNSGKFMKENNLSLSDFNILWLCINDLSKSKKCFTYLKYVKNVFEKYGFKIESIDGENVNYKITA